MNFLMTGENTNELKAPVSFFKKLFSKISRLLIKILKNLKIKNFKIILFIKKKILAFKKLSLSF